MEWLLKKQRNQSTSFSCRELMGILHLYPLRSQRINLRRSLSFFNQKSKRGQRRLKTVHQYLQKNSFKEVCKICICVDIGHICSDLASYLAFTPLRCPQKVSLNLLLCISSLRSSLMGGDFLLVLDPTGLPAFLMGKALPYLKYLLVFFIFLPINYPLLVTFVYKCMNFI